jgi:hypothetical protein
MTARTLEMTRTLPRFKTLTLTAGLALLGSACGVSDERPEDGLATAERELVAGCPLSAVDGDADGLDDGLENCLLQRHAPVVYLAWDIDQSRPANVDWYLARTHMRFTHDGCSDCAILGLGSVTQSALASRTHAEKNWVCSHTSTTRASYGDTWNEAEHFFLQVPNDANETASHQGSTNPADWKVYGHAYRNSLGGVNLQYWFFYPYNDSVSVMNHEGDWEHVNVRLRADYSIDGAFLAQHGGVTLYPAAQLQWFDANHPYVWAADGSHATYRSESDCDTAWREQGFDTDSCRTNSLWRWFTWAGGKGTQSGFQGGGVINVGEKTRPLNGQNFIKYNSRWGEIGNTSATSGPRTPSFQSKWTWDA